MAMDWSRVEMMLWPEAPMVMGTPMARSRFKITFRPLGRSALSGSSRRERSWWRSI